MRLKKRKTQTGYADSTFFLMFMLLKVDKTFSCLGNIFQCGVQKTYIVRRVYLHLKYSISKVLSVYTFTITRLRQ